MQRYFLNENAELNQRFFIHSSDDVHHIKNVMRLEPDDNIIINFNNGAFIAVLIAVDKAVEVETTEQLNIQTELPVRVTIAGGLLKNDKYEWMIQKATELGAAHFIAFISDRTIVKVDQKKMDKRLERFNKIVKEAAEQSYRLTIPTVSFQRDSQSLAKQLAEYDAVLIAYEEEAKSGGMQLFHQALNNLAPGANVLIIFGPEGGLSPSEVEQFGGDVIGLGPRILRAETAPLYALSAVSYHFELMA